MRYVLTVTVDVADERAVIAKANEDPECVVNTIEDALAEMLVFNLAVPPLDFGCEIVDAIVTKETSCGES